MAVGLGVGAAVFASAQAFAEGPPSDSGPTTTTGASVKAGASAATAKHSRQNGRIGGATKVGTNGSRVSPTVGGAGNPAGSAARKANPTAALGLTALRQQTATTSPQAAAVATSAALKANSITTNPTVTWTEGILVGNAGATSDLPLAYSVVRKPNEGGKLGGGPLLPLTNFAANGDFTYVPYATVLTDPTGSESFKIMAFEITKFDQNIAKLFGELGPVLVPTMLGLIHRIPIVGTLLSPIIGASTVVDFTVNPNELAAGRPTDFTYKMPSFDGTLISVNYFPAVNLANGTVDSAPTVLAASGLACAANTDPTTLYGQLFPSKQFGSLTPGIKPLRTDSYHSPLLGGPSYDGGGGYNVITWDPRGEFASGGQLQIDNPFYEGRDVSEIISWLTGSTNPAQDQVLTDPTGDPLVGMTGGSYGGGIQLTTVDPRIDAIIPEIGWNSLISSLYPNRNQFKTGFGTILAAALAFTGARINPLIYAGIFTGVVTGKLTTTQQTVLETVGPTSLLSKEQAPTLQMQGIDDTLFLLQESVDAGQTIVDDTTVPYKLFWFCGGHGTCSIPNKPFEQDGIGVIQNLQWLDQYVAGDPLNPADGIPNFQWYDQDGIGYSSDLLPFEDGFNPLPSYTTTDNGGFLGIWPYFGGSNAKTDLPFSITNAAKARNALNVSATPALGSQIVGAPTLSFDYSGLGTSRTVYAQLVDDTTGLVLSNNSTPIPVVLDGRKHTVEIPMANIAYTVDTGDSLTLQITSSALNYENFTAYGFINISDINLALPIHAIV
ncbi:MAG: peptidase S15 [Mycobacterium sp.]|nr:peptidase S15 [Mycobacterium sp.]